jgi:hypothetical protein
MQILTHCSRSLDELQMTKVMTMQQEMIVHQPRVNPKVQA